MSERMIHGVSTTDRTFDLVIAGGKVLDGTGAPWYYADIGIKDGKIAAVVRTNPGHPSPLIPVSGGAGTAVGVADVTPGGSASSASVLDATGLVVSPGFIDMHSHSDLSLLGVPTSDSKTMQGVTTEVIGQCGFSASPMTSEAIGSLKAILGDTGGIKVDWLTFGEYADRVRSAGTSVNVAGLVGHGTVRTAVMGFRAAAPGPDELETMKRLVEGAMLDGAYGVSTGLIYTPGSYSDTAEVTALAKVAAEHGGTYFTHMRSESRGLMTAVAEAIGIGRDAGMPVQISHLKCAGAARGSSAKLLAAIDMAREQGIEVTADQYPYTAGATGLSAMLPPWVHEGGSERMKARLLDPGTRARIRADMGVSLPGWDNDFGTVGFDSVLITKCADSSLEGRTVQQVADSLGRDPYETLFDILGRTDPGTSMVVFMMTDEDVRTIMAHEAVMIGTDATGCVAGSGGVPHPRTFGTFPRVLGQCAREQGVISLARAVFKMTGFPAAKLGLQDRGLLREGFAADITVFDPETVADTATYQASKYPVGVSHVLVNGQFVVKDGAHTGARPGRFLKKS